MKIGFLITYFYPKTGGAENNCYYTARELAKKHEVHVFTSGEKESEEKINGIYVHRCKELLRVKYYFAFYPSLTNKLAAAHLDVLHVHGFGFMQHDRAIKKIIKAQPKIKIVCTPHGPFMALKKYNFAASIFKALYLPSFRKSLQRYDAIIAVNPEQYKWMEKEYGISRKKVFLVPNGINKETIANISRKEIKKIDEKYGLAKKMVVSYLGRVQRYKGLDQVVSVLPVLRNFTPEIVFLIIGKDSGDRERLEKIAKEKGVDMMVRFTGEVSEEDKLALLERSEIFVFPSEWEAFGIATLEAMARRNAIVSTRTEGSLFLIKEGVNGILFDYGDANALKKALQKLLNNPKIRHSMKKINKKKSRRFLWTDIANKLEKIYIMD